MNSLQGTIANFDEDASGEAVLDNGRRVAFDSAAFAVSGLRFLRPGQRVRLELDGAGSVVAVTVLTMHP